MRRETFRSNLFVIFLMLLGSLALAQRDGSAPAPSKKTVNIKEMKFDPASVEVKAGDTVVWTNSDDRDHTVVASDGSFKSDNLKPGGSYSFKFAKEGSFAYACSYHPRMKGTVKVSAEKQTSPEKEK